MHVKLLFFGVEKKGGGGSYYRRDCYSGQYGIQ